MTIALGCLGMLGLLQLGALGVLFVGQRNAESRASGTESRLHRMEGSLLTMKAPRKKERSSGEPPPTTLPQSGPPDQTTLQDLKQSLKKFGSQKETLRKLDTLDARVQVIEAFLSALEPSQPLDVVILALNSQNLAMTHFRPAFVDVFTRRTTRSLSKKYRLGFYTVNTAEIVRRVRLEDEKITLGSFVFSDSTGDLTERLDLIGEEIQAEFIKKQPHRRCVLVASTQCKPPTWKKESQSWNGFSQVFVVLLAPTRKIPPLEKKTRLQWEAFCKQYQGELVSLPSQAEKPGADHQQMVQLTALLQWFVHPVHSNQ